MRETPSSRSTAPLRVSVLVDLLHRPDAGGHVKAWEKLAAAAVGSAEIDLTVHFAGRLPGLRALADNVRFRFHRPAFSTERLPFLSQVPDHTDLAPHHPALARHLADADLLHTTDAFFAYARTAERIARRRKVPLTSSVHTDTPRYTRLFTAATIERLFGPARLGRWLGRLFDERLGLPRRSEARMRRRLLEHQRLCAAALVSRPEEVEPLSRLLAPGRVGLLRRGIDRALFSPAHRDRAWLEATFGIPAGRVVILFVGRIDRGKNVLTLVEAVEALTRAGRPLHLFCAGEGAERQAVGARLGPAASCPGMLSPAELARVYASTDVVAHPSEIEESSNVAREALASGRAFVTTETVARGLVTDGEDGIVVREGSPAAWSAALARLEESAALRDRLGAAARRRAETTLPSWRDVLEQDLVSVWRRVHAEAQR
ncbi:MAG TPA: glycosyltransferase [Polyangia bacterium]|jgi:glycosyltransferase involved in cell wall biosynthesis|nr:glycosyltransferase [Polyangia bacterium]